MLATRLVSTRNYFTQALMVPSRRKLVVFDLDETLLSRYVNGLGGNGSNIQSHVAPCSSRQTYYWINKHAWKIVLPLILKYHTPVILTSSVCHEPRQIRDAVTKDLLEGTDLTFADVPYIGGNEYGNRYTKKGDKISLLKDQPPFSSFSLQDMLLIDDNIEHVASAVLSGINAVQAGRPKYFQDICRHLELYVDIPEYDTYSLGWDAQNKCVVIDEIQATNPDNVKLT